MPKRKRSDFKDDEERMQRRRKHDIQENLTQSKKLLHRALKTAKGFERQKLGKRLKNAASEGKSDEVARINREIETLKKLDLDKTTEAHLHKTILKVKAFAESELLPEEIKVAVPKPDSTEEERAAIHNVTSGMYNTKPVKDAVAKIMSGMYITMAIPAPVGKSKVVREEKLKSILKTARVGTARGETELPSIGLLDGFESEEQVESGDNNEEGDARESMDEEDISKYDALLGGSSDEESFDEEKFRKSAVRSAKRESLSLSPSPSASPPLSRSLLASPSISPEPKLRPKKTSKSKTVSTKPGSTFLPSLIGGYWSGTESEASDIEDSAPQIRKNRPGQAARRAIWEKKYGEKANHIKSGQPPIGSSRRKDDGWDPKRGAKDESNGGSRGFRAKREIGRPDERGSYRATGDNAITVQPRKRGMGKKDDVGVLHPSWQAAKNAKDIKKTAKFEGKKVTFD